MKEIMTYTNNIGDYLRCDHVIDFDHTEIIKLSDELFRKATNEIEFVQAAYEFVRDHIGHSADINENQLTCTASEVLLAGHGICFAKSHLLAAILRSKSIPTGFCYQKLILDDDTAPVLIYHGLNGVYIKDIKKWIRLDARGNKPGVNAQFSLDYEYLAFPIREEWQEVDNRMIYPNPDEKVLEKFRAYRTRTELWNDLPTQLGYLQD